MRKIITILIILTLSMSVVSATWWNPFTWLDEETEETYTTDKLDLKQDVFLSEQIKSNNLNEFVNLKSKADNDKYESELIDSKFNEHLTKYKLVNETTQELRSDWKNVTYEKEYFNNETNETYLQEYNVLEKYNYTVDVTKQIQKPIKYTYKRHYNLVERSEELKDNRRFHRDEKGLDKLSTQLTANEFIIGNRIYTLQTIDDITYIVKSSFAFDGDEIELRELTKWTLDDFSNSKLDANSNIYKGSILKALGLE